MINRFRLLFAERCAWRGFYLYWLGAPSHFRSVYHTQDFGRLKTMLMRLTIDPTASKPHITFGMRYRFWGPRWAREFSVTIPLPFLRWKPNASRLRRALYRRSSWLQHRLDGRYGWGTEAHRETQRLKRLAREVGKDRLVWAILAFGLTLYGGLGLVLTAFAMKGAQ